MGSTYTIRLGNEAQARLERRARRIQEPPRTLARRYIEEGLRRDDHPLIRFADGPAGRRAALTGSGIDVWEVIAAVTDLDGDLAAAAEQLDLPAHLIDAAVTYYGAFKDEVDAWIEANEQAAEEAQAGLAAGRRALSR